MTADDQVSVAEYEYSALLYLTRYGSAAPTEEGGTGATADGAAAGGAAAGVAAAAPVGDFEGGRLVFHDLDADRVVLPEPGVLVAFESGAPNLHAVQRVTRGSRFALTMWFTSKAEMPGAAVDPTHAAMQQWAAALPDPRVDAPSSITPPLTAAPSEVISGHQRTSVLATAPPPPLPPLPAPPSSRLPSREESLVSAAICSLPANDPLNRALVIANAAGGHQLGAILERALGIPAALAFATPRPPPGQPPPPLRLVDGVGGALLASRVGALDALQTTQLRARAERAAQQRAKRPTPTQAVPGLQPPPPDPLPAPPVGADAPAPAKSGDDAFSVFDF